MRGCFGCLSAFLTARDTWLWQFSGVLGISVRESQDEIPPRANSDCHQVTVFYGIAQTCLLGCGSLEFMLHSNSKGSTSNLFLQQKAKMKVFLGAKYRGCENKKVQVMCLCGSQRGGGTCFGRSLILGCKMMFPGCLRYYTPLSYENLNTFLKKLIILRKSITLHYRFLLQIKKDDINTVQTAGLAV